MSIMDTTRAAGEGNLREHLQSTAASRLTSAAKRRRQLRTEMRQLSNGDKDRILFASRAGMSARRIAELAYLSRPTVDKVIAQAKATGELTNDEIR